MKFGYHALKRKEIIKKIVGNKNGKTFSVRVGNRLEHLIQHSISIDFPKYRIENGRTKAAQLEYLARHGNLPKNLFARDTESEAVQKSQHDILREMTHEQGLFSYFKKHPEQDQPLILTSDGYVLNGNRRLCAWRELLKSNKKKFKRFNEISVVFLPACDPDLLRSIESGLQIKKDIKADYTWISEAVLAKDLRDNEGYDDDKLETFFGEDIKEVQKMIDKLDYANEYLNSRGHSFKYSEIYKDKYAFDQLVEGRKAFKNEPEKQDMFKELVFHVIQSVDADGRKYGKIKTLKKSLDRLVHQLETELPGGKKTHKVGEVPSAGIIKAVAVPATNVKVLKIVNEVLISQDNHDKRKKQRSYVVDLLLQANKSIQSAILGVDEYCDAKSAVAQIEVIEKALKDLRRLLK